MCNIVLALGRRFDFGWFGEEINTSVENVFFLNKNQKIEERLMKKGLPNIRCGRFCSHSLDLILRYNYALVNILIQFHENGRSIGR